MKNYNLNISAPTDGRYSGLCEEINKIFSEHNLIKMRLKLRLNGSFFYLIKKALNLYQSFQNLRLGNSEIYQDFGSKDSLSVKKLKILQSMM